MFPAFPSPAPHSVWKTSASVLTSPPHKRKASPMELDQQPPLKKTATDGEVSVDLANSSPSHKKEETGTQASVDSKIGSPSSSGQMKNQITTDGEVISSGGDTQGFNISAVLAQVWKDELNSGRILTSLVELFGENILSFIQTREMYMIL
ncbi:transcription initiation factor TFIID subunit 6-like [Trifolium pratense]|uniref:transcription initiation factor TFIID subunit 6-like n=1 Tax=Trifolium pratense TaxID=57577 RepID=UPI001E694B4A|nr:transcription initiation factor TFIID subunit 6-like [Trifolium pratense]XP_045787252.1 transcription initiation factor TFIID subunit 6-like [Trifolium pratense]